ncbi:MAG: hypothetical protein IJ764_04470 [Bacteroidales bacterium]|nr:hypothetical protein [Bacteroidales bacterium]
MPNSAASPSSINTSNTENDTVQEQTARGIVFNQDISNEELLGSIFLFHYKPGTIWIDEISQPTLSAEGLNFFDRLDRIDGDYFLSKGGIGLSHYSLYPTLSSGLDWYFQPDINRGYGKTPTSVNFYQVRRPYTVLGYASSLNSEYQIKASHTRNIIPRWNVSFDIDFLNPDEIYANSEAKNSYLDFTTNYYSPDSRYQLYAGLIWQKLRMGENGGVTSDSVFTENSNLTGLSGIPVRSTTNRTLYNQLTLFSHQSYNMARQVDRVITHSRVEAIDSLTLDTVYWDDTLRPASHKVINAGVIGVDVSWQRWKHLVLDSAGTDSAIFHNLSGDLFWTNDAFPDAKWHNPLKITIGIKPQLVYVNEMDSLTYTMFDLSPYVRLDKTIGRGVATIEAENEMGDNCLNNDRRMALSYFFPFDSLRHLTASLTSQRIEADFFYLHNHGNGLHWDMEDQLKKIETFKGELHYQKSNKIDLTLTANNIKNHVWLSSASMPVQGLSDFWLLQTRIVYHLNLWGWLRYDMQQMVQYCSDEDQMRVPLWASKNSIYTDVQLFKKALTMQVGLDIRYHTKFYADGYLPSAGAFYHQNDVKVGGYLWGDVFVNLQLKRAVIYAKAGHLNSLWESHPNYFILPHYPGNKFGLYYGVIWKFFD